MIEGRRLVFGVSGLLYQGNLLFFDRETDSLWSQLLSEAVTGFMAGTRLAVLPAENTTWAAWRNKYPKTLVMSLVTGYQRNYAEDPYKEFPLARDEALLVSLQGVTKIYPLGQLKKANPVIVDQLGGDSVTIEFDKKSKTALVRGADPKRLIFFVSFLGKLKAFYPEAEIYRFQH